MLNNCVSWCCMLRVDGSSLANSLSMHVVYLLKIFHLANVCSPSDAHNSRTKQLTKATIFRWFGSGIFWATEWRRWSRTGPSVWSHSRSPPRVSRSRPPWPWPRTTLPPPGPRTRQERSDWTIIFTYCSMIDIMHSSWCTKYVIQSSQQTPWWQKTLDYSISTIIKPKFIIKSGLWGGHAWSALSWHDRKVSSWTGPNLWRITILRSQYIFQGIICLRITKGLRIPD